MGYPILRAMLCGESMNLPGRCPHQRARPLAEAGEPHQEASVMAAKLTIRGFLGAAIGSLMLGAIAQPASAVEISQHVLKDSAEVNAVLLKGKIDDGDTFDLQVYIASLPKKPSIVVYLDSPGGNLREGMRLGRFFNQNKIETVVDSKTRCTSACALAFLGGRDSNGKPQRTKASSAGVGFHSFTRDFDKERQYTADDLKVVIQRTQTEVYGVAEYLRSIGSDMDFLRIMLRAANNEMNFISNDDAIALGVRVYDEKRKQMIEPQDVMDRLDRSRSAATTAPATPAVSPAASAIPSAARMTRSPT